MKSINLKEEIKSYTLLVIGNFLFSLGAVLLVEPYGFAPGGTYGLAMVAHHLWGWRTEVCAVSMDIPLLIIGTLVIGRKFGIKTLISTLIIPVFMFLSHTFYGYDSLIEPGISDITQFQEPMLAALFGGVVYGIGLGMVYRSGATSGGSDIITMILKKYLHIPMGAAMVIVDGLITLTTIPAFGDWKLPMFSWIIIFITSVVIDRIIEGEPCKTMMIISDKIDEIKQVILEDMERGATLIPAKGMYMGNQRDIIYVVLSRREMVSLRIRISQIDPAAFINVINSSEILGEGFKPLGE